MKKIDIITLLLSVGISPVYGQIDSVYKKDFRTNLAIPDIPAFNMISKEPSNLLRPSDTKALSTAVSNFTDGSTLLLPRDVGIEVAPFLLFDRKLLPSNYYDKSWNRIKESFRISAASISIPNSNEAREAAIGFRITFDNGHDLNQNENYKQAIFEVLESDLASENTCYLKWINSNNLNKYLPDSNLVFRERFHILFQTPEYRKGVLYLRKQSVLPDRLKKLKEEFERKNWNAGRFDAAIAIKGRSSDSLAKNLRFSNASAWLTGAIKLGDVGQFLIGGRYSYGQRDTLIENELKQKEIKSASFPVRFYIGSNKYKAYGEAQYTWNKIDKVKSNNFFLSLGSELFITEGFWAVLSAGWERNWTQNTSSFVSNFNLRFTLPDRI